MDCNIKTMDGWMMDGRMDRWIDGWVDGGWMDGWIDGDGLMNEGMDGGRNGWGWMDRCKDK